MKKLTIQITSIILLVLVISGGIVAYKKISYYKNLDATYSETFPDFSYLKEDLKGQDLLIHLKTGFKFDDAQGCVAFNMAFSALQAGIKTTILIDGSGTYLFKDNKLATYPLPERMRKYLASQAQMDLASFPKTYKEFVEYLNNNGVDFVMNGAMNLVSGYRQRVYQPFDNYKFIKPLSAIEVVDKIMKAGRYLAY